MKPLDPVLAQGYRNAPNAADKILFNEIELYSTIKDIGGIHKVCCPNLRRDQPWLNMPGDAKRFQWIGQIQVSQITAANTDTIVLQRQVDYGYDGSIASIVCRCFDPAFIDGSGMLQWRLQVNTYWVPDCGQIITSLGSLSTPFEVGFVRVQSGQLVTFYVNATASALGILSPTSYIQCALIGWEYAR